MRSGLSPQGQKRAEQAAAKKDLPRLEELLAGERIAKSAAKAIREAPELTGQEEVLERGRVLAAGDPALMAPLDRLSQLYHLLCAAGHRDAFLLDLSGFLRSIATTASCCECSPPGSAPSWEAADG